MSELTSLKPENSGAEGGITLTNREADPVLDPAAIERLIITCGEGGEAVVASLLDMFFGEVRRLLETVRRGRAEGDADEVRRAAHTLKSHGATFGAPFLAHVAREVEILAAQSDLTGAGNLMDELEAESERARQALEATHRALLNSTVSRLAA
jgi:HPt (histidine-containing phosphotransfer) domain-containing protein